MASMPLTRSSGVGWSKGKGLDFAPVYDQLKGRRDPIGTPSFPVQVAEDPGPPDELFSVSSLRPLLARTGPCRDLREEMHSWSRSTLVSLSLPKQLTFPGRVCPQTCPLRDPTDMYARSAPPARPPGQDPKQKHKEGSMFLNLGVGI